MVIETHLLSNGIRIIHTHHHSPVGNCALIINTGSRDEAPNEHGMAHFIEHVIFKGTQKRKAFHILSRLDDVGGELNAYTTKEETCIYASFLKEDYDRALELIHDITFNSIFPNKELEKEKEVIVDEINSYKDSPSELIFDDFEELIYPNDPMGRNILGTAETLRTFTREDVLRFIANNYHTDQMVICSVGNIAFKRLCNLCERYFGSVKPNLRSQMRREVTPYVPQQKEVKMDTYQSHMIIGNVAYDLNHPKRLGLHLLNNILGGPGSNSRLNMSLREKNGIAYNVESSYSPYFNTGVFTIYFGTDEENLARSMRIINKELNLLRNQTMGSLQLHKAQRQLKGQMTIATENKESLMLSLGKSFLLYDKVDALETIYKKIDAITATDLMEIANDILAPEKLSYLTYR
ncbi:MAG: insulinase family protein [Marinilabiliaceae bacterium]|nr:insulinase family protein [Marinilabiliaceae bacterium]